MTDQDRGPRVRALLGEAVVVTASILIAFSLDAAWDNRELDRELDQDLASVAAEIQTNIEVAGVHIALATRIADSSTELLRALRAAPEREHIAVVDTLVWWQTMTPTYEPSLGAIDAVAASGRMSAIRNRELSRRLASLRSSLEDAVEEEYEAQSYFEAIQAPRVFARLDLSDLHYLTDQFVGSAMREPLESRQVVDHPNSTEIRSAIEYRRYLYLEAVASLRGVVADLEGIQALLAAR